jgi:predicted P-loop ATPase
MNELDDSIETAGKILNDGLQAEIRCLMRDMKFKSMAAVTDAYTMNAYHNRYHPIKDFLNALAWDGADHIAALAKHFTCSDTPVVYSNGTTTSVIHAFLKRWLVGAVGKVYEQAQNVTLTMAGPQGIGKSFVAKWLCSPMRDFFNEGQLDPDGKETDRRLATTWIWEIGELGATTRRSDVNALKNKLTQETVKFRVPYGHSDVIKPVLTSFIGTVNPDGRGFLVDKTGNRRFAVVNITAIDHGYSKAIDAAQIWAQAVALYRAGEPWRLTPEERATQEGINAEHTTEDALTMIMGALFHIDPTNDNWRMSPFDVAHTLLMNNYAKDIDKCAKDASAWLRAHGHEKRGKPLSWRGINAKLSGEIEQDRLDVKNSVTRDTATNLGL